VDGEWLVGRDTGKDISTKINPGGPDIGPTFGAFRLTTFKTINLPPAQSAGNQTIRPFNPDNISQLKTRQTIGRKDKADFPELGLATVDIKVDTGAYTSAIHCHEIGTKEVNGKEVLFFTLLDPSYHQYANKELSTESFTQKSVKNSFGGSEKRFVIKTNILIFGKTYPIDLSLSERGEMRFPILIGRKFLMKKFVVDPAKFDLSHKLKSSTNDKA
jgi:hypothetical protein